MPSTRRSNPPRQNVREGSLGNLLEELVWKYGVGDTVPVSIGAGNYDSGRVELPDSDTAVTSTDTYVSAIVLSNQTTQMQPVTIRDGNGNVYVNLKNLQPKEFLVLQFHGALLSGGIRWNAAAAATVVGQIMGSQDA